MSELPVVVIGAGPLGLAAALSAGAWTHPLVLESSGSWRRRSSSGSTCAFAVAELVDPAAALLRIDGLDCS